MFVGGQGQGVLVGVQDAGVEESLLSVLLLVGGEDEGTDAVGVQVDEGEGLLHLGRPLQDVRLHHVALPELLSLLLGPLRLLHLLLGLSLLGLGGFLFLLPFHLGLDGLLPLLLLVLHGGEVMVQSVHELIEECLLHEGDLAEEEGILILNVAFGLLIPTSAQGYFSYISGSFFFMAEFQ